MHQSVQWWVNQLVHQLVHRLVDLWGYQLVPCFLMVIQWVPQMENKRNLDGHWAQ